MNRSVMFTFVPAFMLILASGCHDRRAAASYDDDTSDSTPVTIPEDIPDSKIYVVHGIWDMTVKYAPGRVYCDGSLPRPDAPFINGEVCGKNLQSNEIVSIYQTTNSKGATGYDGNLYWSAVSWQNSVLYLAATNGEWRRQYSDFTAYCYPDLVTLSFKLPVDIEGAWMQPDGSVFVLSTDGRLYWSHTSWEREEGRLEVVELEVPGEVDRPDFSSTVAAMWMKDGTMLVGTSHAHGREIHLVHIFFASNILNATAMRPSWESDTVLGEHLLGFGLILHTSDKECWIRPDVLERYVPKRTN